MAAVGVSLTVFLQNTKSANISKTVRDRVILSEFLTCRVVQEYLVAILKIFKFYKFWRPS